MGTTMVSCPAGSTLELLLTPATQNKETTVERLRAQVSCPACSLPLASTLIAICCPAGTTLMDTTMLPCPAGNTLELLLALATQYKVIGVPSGQPFPDTLSPIPAGTAWLSAMPHHPARPRGQSPCSACSLPLASTLISIVCPVGTTIRGTTLLPCPAGMPFELLLAHATPRRWEPTSYAFLRYTLGQCVIYRHKQYRRSAWEYKRSCPGLLMP